MQVSWCTRIVELVGKIEKQDCGTHCVNLVALIRTNAWGIKLAIRALQLL
jgi:hypothetical protein